MTARTPVRWCWVTIFRSGALLCSATSMACGKGAGSDLVTLGALATSNALELFQASRSTR